MFFCGTQKLPLIPKVPPLPKIKNSFLRSGNMSMRLSTPRILTF